MTEDEPKRTREELGILDPMCESRGEEFVEEHAELILAQAQLVGEI